MGKNIKLGNCEPTIKQVKIFGTNETDGKTKLLANAADPLYGVEIQADMNELARSVALLGSSLTNKVTAADFIGAMIKTSPDEMEDQLFDICKVVLNACLRQVDLSEGIYYHPLRSALAVCEDITNNL